MISDAQKELCANLRAPQWTADDGILMAEAANEIEWLANRFTPNDEANIDMLSALQEVLKAPGLQSGLQALCAAAVAKATGRSIEDVITGA
jgi:hypothetical protein